MTSTLDQIAIIGMAGRFPGAPTLKHYWQNLAAGVESVSFFSRDELRASGVPEERIANRQYVGAKGIIEGADRFDARYFDLSDREATVMDPQFRVFLETVVEAMEGAGYGSGDAACRTGIFAGAGLNTYQEYLRANRELVDLIGQFRATTLNEKDFLPAWAAYKLNLTGPCVTVQSTCATSLVAAHLACQSLLNGECDLAIVGAVSLSFPQKAGYLYVEGGLLSPDGRCRAFDAKAMGCVPGEGVGVVVLKRLEDAFEQGDNIRAIIRASSINNDGSDKVGFLAPSESGIATAVAESIAISGIDCESIRYIEAHGTATPLGDPVEMAALTNAFRAQTEKKQFCAIGSVKANIGHLDAAAGIASLIKTVLAMENGVIPPSLNCEEPNPLIKFSQTPFYVSTQAEEWSRNGVPRRAAVNAFGVGGTNAHMILEEAPFRESAKEPLKSELILLSARSETALERASENLADFIEGSPEISLSDVAYTLSVGRRAHDYRRFLVYTDAPEAVKALKEAGPAATVSYDEAFEDGQVTFVFRDRGAEYPGMGSDLYRDEPVFRQGIERCAAILQPLVNLDIRSLVASNSTTGFDCRELLARDRVSRAASVAVEYSLAKLLISWGVSPQAVAGEGTGEYAAACISGHLSLEESLAMAAADTGANSGTFVAAAQASDQIYEREVSRVPFFSAALGKWANDKNEFVIEDWLESLRGRTPAARSFEATAEHKDRILLEIGPPNHPPDGNKNTASMAIGTLRHESEATSNREKLLTALGRLWLAHVPVDWQASYSNRRRFRIPLPTYPFESRRYWAGADSPETDFSSEFQAQSISEEPTTGWLAPSERVFDEPVNDLQAVVASVWATYLDLDRVGIHEGFFELGGNSIAATRIVMTIRETLQVDLPLRSIIDHPTVAGLSEDIEKAALQLDTDVHQIAQLVREIVALPSDQVEERLTQRPDLINNQSRL